MQHGMHLLIHRPGLAKAGHVDEGVKPGGKPPDFGASSHEQASSIENTTRWIRSKLLRTLDLIYRSTIRNSLEISSTCPAPFSSAF